jgi:hypothetical protein
MLREFFDTMPLWGILVTTVIVVWLAKEVGFRLGFRLSNKSSLNNETQITATTGANLGLLAFLLAFTFSMAAGHFDTRNKIILEDAKAINTAYLRTRILPGDEGDNIRALLRDYAILRGRIGSMDVAVIISESEKLQSQMWGEIEGLAAGEKLTIAHSLLIQSINAVFNVHEDRIRAGLHNRIPPSIWVALYTVLLLSMVGMGFHSGIKGSRSPVPNAALALSFSMVLFLIADLDRPASGLVTPDQSQIIKLGERFQQLEDTNAVNHPRPG